MKLFVLTALVFAAPQIARAADEDCGCYGGAPVAAATELNAVAPDKVLLRLKLTPGQKYVQTYEIEMRTTVVSPLTRQAINQKLSIPVNNEVLAVSPQGETQIRRTYGDVKVILTVLNTQGKISSVSKAMANIAARISKAMTGKPITTTLSSRAKSIKTSGSGELLDAMLMAIPTSNADDHISEALINGFLTANNTISISNVLPEAPIAVGDSWHDSKSKPVDSRGLSADPIYTVKTISDGMVRTGVIGNADIKPLGQVDIDDATISSVVKESGEMDWDIATGLNINRHLNAYTIIRLAYVKDKKNSVTYSNITTRLSTAFIAP